MDEQQIPQQPLTKKQQKELRRQEKGEQRLAELRRQQMKRVVTWAVVILVLGGIVALMAWLASRTPSTSGPTGTTPLDAIAEQDHIKGNPASPVVLIEYSDFQCPACAAYYPIVKQLAEDFGNEFAFAYRHFPLRASHRNAAAAAQAAEAAHAQGKFWEMHDMLFEKQSAWSGERNPDALFESYAISLGLDIEKFKSDYASGAVSDRVKSDEASGRRAGVNSTPSFFLNGTSIQPPPSYDAFKSLITNARGITPTNATATSATNP